MPKSTSKKEKPGHRQNGPKDMMKIERFKLKDGREGSMAPMGNGLIKLLCDNGDMMIVKAMD
jgi:hypothetical protein